MMRRPIILAAAFAAVPAVAQIPSFAATPQARAQMTDFAGCVARTSPGMARSALTMDFTTKAYARTMLALADNNRTCHRRRGRMRASGLPFAAGMAEALLAQDPNPLNVRLLRAARTEAPTFSPSDRMAMCVARSDPDGVAALLGSAQSSVAEIAAAAKLTPVVNRCMPGGLKYDPTPYGLRAIVATASYRLLSSAK